jgi:L-ribulose-5-phosphate 4-epimerase
VWEANLKLVSDGLVIDTWGNASGIDRPKGLMVIKPSGVPYEGMRPEHMIVVELDSGRVVEGQLKPSSDTPTHLVLYRAFAQIGGVVHTHSLYATAWAQARRALPALGTTHADYFNGPIPCTRLLKLREIRKQYEANTGEVIVEAFRKRDPLLCPAALVASHGPFAWGRNATEAAHNAVILEHLARLGSETSRLSPSIGPMPSALLEKHFGRKHGPGAYYGQGRKAHGFSASGDQPSGIKSRPELRKPDATRNSKGNL